MNIYKMYVSTFQHSIRVLDSWKSGKILVFGIDEHMCLRNNKGISLIVFMKY